MTANGLGLCDGGAYKAQMLNLAQMLIKAQMLNLALHPHYCKTPVSGSLLCVLRCLRIRRYKSSLKRQHNFIRDDRLYEGSETSHAKKRGGLTKDFE